MIGRILAGAAGLCLLAATLSSAQAEPRIALVVGNSNYGKEIGQLSNPVNDANAMEQALRQTGFEVVKVIDANQKQMKRAIADFGDKLAKAGSTATGLFFYAGHGVQVKGVNYLVPVGAEISKEADVDIESLNADTILDQMEYAGARVNIVVLDACRNNPLQRSFRSATRGLAPMEAAQGTFIAYSTSPGSVAADGSGANSPYTAALAKTIVKPGVGIEEAFREVRAQVMAATDDQQIPWDSSSLTAPFFFKPTQFTTASQPSVEPAAKPAAAGPENAQLEVAFWNSIQNSQEPADYREYLNRFPNGTFAGLAKNRLASLDAGALRQQPAAPAAQPLETEPLETEPAAATVATSEPEPVAEPAKKDDGILRDSRGLDCRIKDATRSESECKGVARAGGGGGGYSSGGKSTGSQRWQ